MTPSVCITKGWGYEAASHKGVGGTGRPVTGKRGAQRVEPPCRSPRVAEDRESDQVRALQISEGYRLVAAHPPRVEASIAVGSSVYAAHGIIP